MAELNYHHLRYFHAIVEAGALTKAAERLNVSPSALSVQLGQLEAQLGHKLFDRVGRKLVLTEAGRIALQSAETIFDAGQELLSALRAGAAKRTSVRIGALATLSRNFQVAFLRPIIGRGDVHVVMRSGGMRDLMAMLDAHHIDVLLTNAPPPRDETSSWSAHLIAEQTISLIGPHRRGRKPSADKVLASEPLILPTPENHLRGDFDALAARMRITPRIAAEVDDMAMLRLLTREGFGFGVAPRVVVRDELANGILADYGTLPGLKETFFAISPTRRFPNPVVAALVKASLA